MAGMLTRRSFLEDATLASVAAAFPSAALGALPASTPKRVLPKAIREGQTVGLVSPASPGSWDDAAEIAKEVVASLGLKPKLFPSAAKRNFYLAGTDAERAKDVNEAFRDPAVDVVWCVRGGYGTTRLIPYLDFEAIRKNPKPLIGFSDVTGLLNSIHRATGLVTFHGPNASGSLSDYEMESWKRVLWNAAPPGSIAAPLPFASAPGKVNREGRLFRLAPGKARGPLVGGNISVLTTLVGTPFEPELKGRILFLEEVGEEPYRIDRWLTGLLLTGKLSQLAGVALGRFHDCGPRSVGGGSFQGTWTWQEVCADRLGRLGIPVLAGLSFGHIADNATLPVGVVAELDVDAGTLTLLEPAVL